ncbi:hypothetical protein [Amycolatopsis sp. FDAARGOS 1241]|uniref:hypothetical protein n=1 Tax=Amycolatopsis sp. FDAARGOS 1241 TaxID=2778070 RepID=UPI0019507874|nr:hypothetical protein [Amycolatopsis sp. FDAARGOS 1241]QRP47413.1 hypothetical protein I6J71_05445 [Amycolatopsis sp. FDAARGOS 1241]
MARTSTELHVVERFHDLADTLVRNANALTGNPDLPAAVVWPRADVYVDVATQVRLLADAELARVEGLALVLPLTAAQRAAEQFEWLAGQLAGNARTLRAFTTDPAMVARARVYRDVAVQVRLLAAAEREQHGRPTPPATPARRPQPSPLAARVAARLRTVRPEFTEPLVTAIATRRRAGWSVARLTLWLRTLLRDPQTGELHPCADRSFVSYVTGLLAGQAAARAA